MENSSTKKSIVLIGPSSVGKSLISTELSKKLSIPRVSIDNLFNFVVSEIENEIFPNEEGIKKYKTAIMNDLKERNQKGAETNTNTLELEEKLVDEFLDEYREYVKMFGGLEDFRPAVRRVGSGLSSADEVEYNVMLAKLSYDIIKEILKKTKEPIIIDAPMSFGWEVPKFGLTLESRIWLARMYDIEVEKFNNDMRKMLKSLNPVFLMPGEDYPQRNGAEKSLSNAVIVGNIDCYMQDAGLVVSTNGLFTNPSHPILKQRTWFNTEEYIEQTKLRNNGEISSLCDQIAVGLYELENNEGNENQ